MNNVYNQKAKNYDVIVENLPQDNGKTGRKRTGTTYYIEKTTLDDNSVKVGYQTKTTDVDLVISELIGDLVFADDMIEQIKFERDTYLHSLSSIIDMGIIDVEQIRNIVGETSIQLKGEQTGKKL